MKNQIHRSILPAITRARAGVTTLILAIAAAVLAVSPAAAVDGGAPRIAPPVSQAYGKTLPEWLATYYRWYYETEQDVSQSVVGRVQLLPIPDEDYVSGLGTPDDPALY